MISTTSPGGLVNMSIYISTNDSMEEGMEILNAFKAYLQEQGLSEPSGEEDIDDFSMDEETPYYSEYLEYSMEDENGEVQSEFYADMIVNDGDFLAVTVSIPDWAGLENDERERLYLYLLETCALLSDFSIY
jgi:hypothetical protein